MMIAMTSGGGREQISKIINKEKCSQNLLKMTDVLSEFIEFLKILFMF